MQQYITSGTCKVLESYHILCYQVKIICVLRFDSSSIIFQSNNVTEGKRNIADNGYL